MRRDELYHHGIKGMRWGIRKDRRSGATRLKTKKGKTFYLSKNNPGMLAKFIGSKFKNSSNFQNRSFDYTILDDRGSKIGNLFLYDEGNRSLNVNWVNINKKHRGNGYASEVMKNAVRFAKDNGYKKVTLEVPGESPDARHIYEKLGFKEVRKITDDDDVWEGLTAMELNLKHSDIRNDELCHSLIRNLNDKYIELGEKIVWKKVFY